MLYDYMCDTCRVITEVREKAFSGNQPKNCIINGCAGTMNRRPHRKMVVLYKAAGFTRVSSDDAYKRKLSPWFGGPPENAPDYEAVKDHEESKAKAIAVGKRDGYYPTDEIAKLDRGLEKAVSDSVRGLS